MKFNARVNWPSPIFQPTRKPGQKKEKNLKLFVCWKWNLFFTGNADKK